MGKPTAHYRGLSLISDRPLPGNQLLHLLPTSPLKVISIWECEFRDSLEYDPELKAVTESYMDTICWEALCPRHALYGGRCEVPHPFLSPLQVSLSLFRRTVTRLKWR